MWLLVCTSILEFHQIIVHRKISIRMHNLKNPMHNVLGPLRFWTSARHNYTSMILGTPIYENWIPNIVKVWIKRLRDNWAQFGGQSSKTSFQDCTFTLHLCLPKHYLRVSNYVFNDLYVFLDMLRTWNKCYIQFLAYQVDSSFNTVKLVNKTNIKS